MLFRTVIIGIVGLVIAGLTAISRAEPVLYAREPASVVFVCGNGVSMSVWSAAYFNRLAIQRGLPQRATSRSTVPPSTDVPLRMRIALAIDGFRLDGYQPRIVQTDDVGSAELIVVIESGTTVPPDVRVPERATTEHWQGFPAMRDDYFPSRAELKRRVEAVVARMSTAGSGTR